MLLRKRHTYESFVLIYGVLLSKIHLIIPEASSHQYVNLKTVTFQQFLQIGLTDY